MGAAQRLAPGANRAATTLARVTFAVWGLMTEIVGATLVVGTMSVTAAAIAAAGLMMAN